MKTTCAAPKGDHLLNSRSFSRSLLNIHILLPFMTTQFKIWRACWSSFENAYEQWIFYLFHNACSTYKMSAKSLSIAIRCCCYCWMFSFFKFSIECSNWINSISNSCLVYISDGWYWKQVLICITACLNRVKEVDTHTHTHTRSPLTLR